MRLPLWCDFIFLLFWQEISPVDFKTKTNNKQKRNLCLGKNWNKGYLFQESGYNKNSSYICQNYYWCARLPLAISLAWSEAPCAIPRSRHCHGWHIFKSVSAQDKPQPNMTQWMRVWDRCPDRILGQNQHRQKLVWLCWHSLPTSRDFCGDQSGLGGS